MIFSRETIRDRKIVPLQDTRVNPGLFYMHIVILRCVMRATAVLSTGIIFSFHAGVLLCPIICPVNPAEPKTTTQYASKSLSGPLAFLLFLSSQDVSHSVTLRDVQKFHGVPRQNSVLYRAPQEISFVHLTSRGMEMVVSTTINDTARAIL